VPVEVVVKETTGGGRVHGTAGGNANGGCSPTGTHFMRHNLIMVNVWKEAWRNHPRSYLAKGNNDGNQFIEDVEIVNFWWNIKWSWNVCRNCIVAEWWGILFFLVKATYVYNCTYHFTIVRTILPLNIPFYHCTCHFIIV